MKKDQVEKAIYYFDLDPNIADSRTVYLLAGKTVMTVLLNGDLESVEIIEIDEKIIRRQKSAGGYFATARISNATDFPDFSKLEAGEMRREIEKSFLVVAAGIWAKSISQFQEASKAKKLNFDRIQMLAVESDASLLLALRSVLSRLQLKTFNLNIEMTEQSLLDYESFLYRQSFAVVSQSVVWRAIVEIAERLKAKRILSGQEILLICPKNKEFIQLRQEITQFYSAD